MRSKSSLKQKLEKKMVVENKMTERTFGDDFCNIEFNICLLSKTCFKSLKSCF